MSKILTALVPIIALSGTVSSQKPIDRAVAWRLHQQMARNSIYKDISWRPVGPRLQGGRIEAIAVHPSKPHTIYVGPGSGNIWKTDNNGSTWTPIFEHESTFTIGDIAIARSDPNVVWVGTGETQPRHSGYSFAGTGVFVSRDAGRTWTNTGLAETHHIGKVLIHPANPDIVYVGAIGHFWSHNPERGVYKTTDGGKTWRKTLFISDKTGVVDLAMHPSNPEILLAAAWQVTHGQESGLYKSVDGGDTWIEMTKGLPKGPTGRAGLAFSPSKPDTVYAFLDNWAPFEGGRRRKIVGAEVYRSDDRGDSWRKVNTDDLYPVFTIYGWKFCDVRVSPEDPDEIFILGNRAYHSKDGGKTFGRIGEQILRLHDTKGKVMHLDHHDLWIDPANPSRLILGNDGGLFISNDRGATWLHVNNLPIGEFYFVAADMAEPYTIYGGTQDNAALYGPAKSIEPFRNDPWQHVFLDRLTGGDAFVTLPDPTNKNIVYYEHQHGAMLRMDITGNVLTGGPSTKHIRPRGPRNDRWRFSWYMPFLISKYDPKTLLAGGNKVVKSSNRGETWQAISPDLADKGGGERAVVPFGTITMLAESPRQEGLIYAGTEGGSLHITKNGGTKWVEVTAGKNLPDKWVSRVIASRHVTSRVYLSHTGFREDDFEKYIFVSENFGKTWRSIAGNLPAESINVVREDPQNPEILYVGTDLGVYASTDRGRRWHSICGNLPTTPVHDLVIHPREREIIVATHGRSIFVASVREIQGH
ncbi:MAG: hypothetical protein VX951_04310 [Planctomycetota bacterium]|nr:hypothetical protein [Planctomycetota bacterium]